MPGTGANFTGFGTGSPLHYSSRAGYASTRRRLRAPLS